jgi:DNA-binding CsgD family transcriptional regulator
MTQAATHLRTASEPGVPFGLASARGIAEGLSVVGHPVALIGRDGRVLHMNARFERLIGDGVHVKAGCIGSWRADADRALAAAINRAVRHGTRREPLSVVLPRRQRLRPLVAHVAPAGGLAPDNPHPVAAIVVLTDLRAASQGPAENVLRQAFGLTPAEARLAKQIAAGKTLADIARQGGSARETLRTRLKGIFAKTRTSRQAELALLLSRMTSPTG